MFYSKVIMAETPQVRSFNPGEVAIGGSYVVGIVVS
ncbi:flagellar biosynthesis protein FlhA [Vibrio chagasii]|nr:flagellar biosynthesis protein FlhA [Vibrio chagasii]